MSNFTLDELAQFSQQEKELRKILQEETHDLPEIEYVPSDLAVRNILNYAKVLSVRDTKNYGKVEMILN